MYKDNIGKLKYIFNLTGLKLLYFDMFNFEAVFCSVLGLAEENYGLIFKSQVIYILICFRAGEDFSANNLTRSLLFY